MNRKELFILAENQEFDKIKTYSESGGDINVVNENKENLIHIIARYDSANSFLEYLIKKGLDINLQEKLMNNTPLMIASNYDCPKNVNTLLAKGANTSLLNTENYSAFSLATFNEFKNCVDVFIENKVDINFHGEKFQTPFIAAIEGETEEEFLLKNGAKTEGVVNKSNETIFEFSQRVGNDEITEFLRQYKNK